MMTDSPHDSGQAQEETSERNSDYRSMFDLAGKVALVTGGSGGLGSAIAFGLATFGADVMLVGRNRQKLEARKKWVERSGRKVLTAECNVTDPHEVESMVALTVEKFGHLDVLVNAHGINIRQPSEAMAVSDWERVVDVNLKSVFLCCKAVGKTMIRNGKGGAIVSLSSTSASIGYDRGYSAYSPSKAGVEALTRTLASEWAQYNIRVNAIAPYFIRTELTKAVLSEERFYNWVVTGLPMKRIGTPLDVAGAAVFLASPASSWITGQTICVDGGRSIT